VNRPQLAQLAMREASRLRVMKRIGLAESICPYDVALTCGLTVQFLSAPTLEGMYEAERAAIMLGSARPAGRRRFTCAHELGHHVFGHGTSLDQLRGPHTDSSNPQEFLADCFAASLLMPKTAIDAAINRRGWRRRPFTPQMLWILAQDLGVGYDTLLVHLNLVLRYLSGAATSQLQKKKPADLRDEFAGFDVRYDAHPVDEHWGTRPVDLEVGDVIVGPLTITEGVSLAVAGEAMPHLVAVRAGIAKLRLPNGRAMTARVARRDFSGRAQFRHEEEAEDEA
jgi:hypothetical protein